MQVRGAISPEDAARINRLDALIDLANNVPSDGGGAKIDLGDFDILGSDPRALNFHLAQGGEPVLRNALQAIQQNPILNEFIQDADALPAQGMQFPIIENPSTMFGLLLGKDVEFSPATRRATRIPRFRFRHGIRCDPRRLAPRNHARAIRLRCDRRRRLIVTPSTAGLAPNDPAFQPPSPTRSFWKSTKLDPKFPPATMAQRIRQSRLDAGGAGCVPWVAPGAELQDPCNTANLRGRSCPFVSLRDSRS